MPRKRKKTPQPKQGVTGGSTNRGGTSSRGTRGTTSRGGSNRGTRGTTARGGSTRGGTSNRGNSKRGTNSKRGKRGGKSPQNTKGKKGTSPAPKKGGNSPGPKKGGNQPRRGGKSPQSQKGGKQVQKGGRKPQQGGTKKSAWGTVAPKVEKTSTPQKLEKPKIIKGEEEEEQEKQVATKAESPAHVEKEDTRVKDTAVANLAQPPQVPVGMKMAGTALTLTVNHFNFSIEKNKEIYQYVVHFIPDVPAKDTRKELVRKHAKKVLGDYYVFDGAMLFTSLNVDDVSIQTDYANIDGTLVSLQIVKTRTLNTAESEQLFNIIFRQVLRILKLKNFGRQHFDPSRRKGIEKHKVELWPGYFTSISVNDGGISLLTDFTHKILRTDSVLEWMYDISYTHKKKWKDVATSQLMGQIVVTRYGNTQRTYRIDDVDWTKNPAHKFKKDDKTSTSYQEYYLKVYNRKILEPQQPLLLHRRKRRSEPDQLIYLIPELCSMTGLTDQMRSDFRVMRDISQYTRVDPSARAKEIAGFVEKTTKNSEVKELLDAWNLRISDKMLRVPGRVFEPEQIIFGSGPSRSYGQADWSSAKSSKLIRPVNLKNWILIFPQKDSTLAEQFFSTLQKVGAPCGVSVATPVIESLRQDRPESYVAAIKKLLTKDTQMVVCIMPNSQKGRYDQIKQTCCVTHPVPSQCIINRTLQKKMMSVVTKIMFQINCKLGGELWKLKIPIRGTMVIGIDVCHDTARGGQSVAGFCASLNEDFTQYYSRVFFQDSKQEVVDGIKICLDGALRRYYKLNNKCPDGIIVYRDGVGDGMLNTLMQHEIPQYYDSFASVHPDYKPKLAVIIVKKRIHTRLFAPFQARPSRGGGRGGRGGRRGGRGGRSPSPSGGGGYSNPSPGTTVSNGCTQKGWYDFFLVSQFSREGTVTPTHYHVIVDSTGLPPDRLQLLTFKLCHLYYNWPGTIRVPAPCQYAHKISFLVGQSIHKDPSETLRDKLYFL